MTTNPHQHEAELMLTEIAKDAGLTGPALTFDQRITVAGIHASLARTAAITEGVTLLRTFAGPKADEATAR